MLARLLQHLLIWLAATVSIVAGAISGKAVGFLSARTERRVLAWMVLALALIFAGGLVQRIPLAIALLVGVGGLFVGFGVWLATAGAPGAGLAYGIIGIAYILTLGPATYRWLREP